MNNIQLNIFGTRLKSARLMSGLSLQELSDKMSNVVTKQALSKYEKGLMNPSSKVLLLLSKNLSLPIDFFLKSEMVSFNQVSFRKKANLTKKKEDNILERSKIFYENYLELENILGAKIEFINPISDFSIKTFKDIEEASKRLRRFWRIGDQPISNLFETLESRGIKVFVMKKDEGVDGISIDVRGGNPMIIVNIESKSLERVRFTAIHELAHTLLKFDKSVESDSKLVEKMCHYFASCFLIPTELLVKRIGGTRRSYIRIEELISIKNYFGISIRAIVYRLKQLEIISDNYYRRWTVWLTKTYGAKNEPGNYMGEERVYRFIQLVNRALSEDLISVSKAASLSNKSINQIKKMEPIER